MLGTYLSLWHGGWQEQCEVRSSVWALSCTSVIMAEECWRNKVHHGGPESRERSWCWDNFFLLPAPPPTFIPSDPQSIVWYHPLSGLASYPQLLLSGNILTEIPRAVQMDIGDLKPSKLTPKINHHPEWDISRFCERERQNFSLDFGYFHNQTRWLFWFPLLWTLQPVTWVCCVVMSFSFHFCTAYPTLRLIPVNECQDTWLSRTMALSPVH